MAKKLTNEEFIDKANQKHNGKYNYSKTIYKNKRTNVIITCPIHGDFEQNPEVHLRGSGCPKCGKSISSNKRLKPKETIIEEFKKTHGDKYDYSLVDYKGTDTKVKIIMFIFNKIFCSFISIITYRATRTFFVLTEYFYKLHMSTKKFLFSLYLIISKKLDNNIDV